MPQAIANTVEKSLLCRQHPTPLTVPRRHRPILHHCSTAFSVMPWDGLVLRIYLPPFSKCSWLLQMVIHPFLLMAPPTHYVVITVHWDNNQRWFPLHSCSCARSWVAPWLRTVSGTHGTLVVFTIFLPLLQVDPEASSSDSSLTSGRLKPGGVFSHMTPTWL